MLQREQRTTSRYLSDGISWGRCKQKKKDGDWHIVQRLTLWVLCRENLVHPMQRQFLPCSLCCLFGYDRSLSTRCTGTCVLATYRRANPHLSCPSHSYCSLFLSGLLKSSVMLSSWKRCRHCQCRHVPLIGHICSAKPMKILNIQLRDITRNLLIRAWWIFTICTYLTIFDKKNLRQSCAQSVSGSTALSKILLKIHMFKCRYLHSNIP